MLVALLAYMIQDWRDLQLTLSVIVLCLAGLYFVLPESPRYGTGEREKCCQDF